MNNSINYSSFISLQIESNDSNKSNGLSVQPNTSDAKAEQSELESLQAVLHNRDIEPWRGE